MSNMSYLYGLYYGSGDKGKLNIFQSEQLFYHIPIHVPVAYLEFLLGGGGVLIINSIYTNYNFNFN